MAASVRDNLAAVRERIERARQRGGQPRPVSLVAVTKTHPPVLIREAWEAGQREFGENRVQEFEQKHGVVERDGAVWHLIGHLQSNKARRAVQLFDVIETVDTERLARRLHDAASEAGRVIPVFIEVKLSGEASKTGCAESELPALADAVRALPRLDLRGLMTMPPYSEDAERARPYFQRLRDWGERLRVPELSMGMSHDFEIAIEEGATLVRVGTAIFGERPRP